MAGLVGACTGGVIVVAIRGTTSGRSVAVVKFITMHERQDGAAQHTNALKAQQIYEMDSSGVVFVDGNDETRGASAEEFYKGDGTAGPATATGSGFEVDGQGTIVTAWHVVQGAARVTVGLGPGDSVPASVVASDPSQDIAALRISTDGVVLHPLKLGQSSAVRVGDSAYAIGNPFGLSRTLTGGLISALGRRIIAPNGLTIDAAMQTDAPINPGNSGGPLLNERGEVIGINSQIETNGDGGGSVGIGFAIPIDDVKQALTKLVKK